MCVPLGPRRAPVWRESKGPTLAERYPKESFKREKNGLIYSLDGKDLHYYTRNEQMQKEIKMGTERIMTGAIEEPNFSIVLPASVTVIEPRAITGRFRTVVFIKSRECKLSDDSFDFSLAWSYLYSKRDQPKERRYDQRIVVPDGTLDFYRSQLEKYKEIVIEESEIG